MRWATFVAKDDSLANQRVGLVEGDHVLALAPGVSLLDLLGDDGTRLRDAAASVRQASASRHRIGEVQLLAPIPRPPAVRDFSSFLEHHRAGIEAIGQKFDDAWFELPFFYFSNPNNMIGDDATFTMPSNCVRMDYELELCCVIGRDCIDVSPDEAEDYIAGYSIFNDWSARDLQMDEMARAPVGPAKGKDSANSMGPFLVTPDELADRRSGNGYDLAMTAKINGKLYSEGNWKTLHWSFAEMISYASRNTRLVPGDVLCSGTVGTGCVLELSMTHGGDRFPWLKAGDLVELEVERLGRLSNAVAVGAPVHPIRGRIVGSRCEAAQQQTREAART